MAAGSLRPDDRDPGFRWDDAVGPRPRRRSAEHGFTLSVRSAEYGFTLIELMVVLVIIGFTSAAVLFAMPDPRGSLRDEAERFAARVRVAQDSAIVAGRPVALRVSAGGYRFEQRVRGRWVALPERALGARRWGEGVAARAGDGDERHLFDPTGTIDPLVLVLTREGARTTVRVDADGAIHVG